MTDTQAALQTHPLFRHLSATRLEQVFASALLQRYEKGAILFQQGTQAEAIWIVLNGWVHLIRTSEDRVITHGVVLFTITPEEALVGLSAIDSGRYSMSAVAATTCTTFRIPREVFHEALVHEPKFAYEALRLCARRIQHIAQQYGTMAEPVAKRIVRSILRLREQFGDTLPVTHRELGQMAWTTTESAIRVVRAMKRKGLLSGVRGRLVVQRPNALEAFLNRGRGGVLSLHDNGHRKRASTSLH